MQNLNNTLQELQSYNDLLIHLNDNLYNRLGVECCKIVALTLSNCVISYNLQVNLLKLY